MNLYESTSYIDEADNDNDNEEISEDPSESEPLF